MDHISSRFSGISQSLMLVLGGMMAVLLSVGVIIGTPIGFGICAGVVVIIFSVLRPDLFVYFLLATIVMNFAREMGGFPIAFEELKILAIPVIWLHRVSRANIVPKLRIRSVYLWPTIFIVAGLVISYFRAESYGDYFRDAGRLVGRISCLWAVINIATTWKRQRLLVQALLLGGLVVSVIIFLQIATQSYTPIFSFFRGDFYTPFSPMRNEAMAAFDGRGTGLGGTNDTACYLATLLPFVVWSAMSSGKTSSYILFGVFALALVLTYSRGGVGGALIGMILLLALSRKANPRALAALSLSGLLIFLTMFSAPVRKTLDLRIAGTEAMGEDRLNIWANSWPLVADHPIVGLGIGNLEEAVLEVNGNVWSQHHLWEKHLLTAIARPHNQYLDLLIESGLVGLVCYLWIFFRALQLGFRAAFLKQLGPRRFMVTALSCGCLAIMIQGVVDSLIVAGMQAGYLGWTLFGLVEATYGLVIADASKLQVSEPQSGTHVRTAASVALHHA